MQNTSGKAILLHSLIAAVSLFFSGFGIYLTIQAGIGASPWDVFSLGLSKTLGILYGNATVAVSFIILVIDVLMREPIGIAMFIDAVTVGKAVDFFNRLGIVSTPKSLPAAILMMLAGLAVIGYMQYFYMNAALGCGPRDSLLVGLARRLPRIPIGTVSVALLAVVTFAGYLLGGPVGLGTLICAFGAGPVMQFAFHTVHFDATSIRHQNLRETLKLLFSRG